ncbi:GLPGLI family protein [Prevotella sp. HUN102]|uniref:GLPGLI family protein n=1 Tax=Prevotella sp. HUN102 TaxID=1392486 RepID=UPI000AD1C45D|nr:GLPGLI family protein [Prevotella sp. HUN102]
MNDFIYRNLEQGKVTTYTYIMFDKYVITEDISTPEWIINEDSVINVLGMECKKATADFRGRHWEVWYTEQIPVSLGPWKLNGLPGLILKANCPGLMSIEATSVSNKNLESVTFYNPLSFKYMPINRKVFLKKMHTPGAYPNGGMGETIERDWE